MNYDRKDEPSGMPSLVNMTEKAIEVLEKNSNGYILMVSRYILLYPTGAKILNLYRLIERQSIEKELQFLEF